MIANTVEDPNEDPNLYSEIDVGFCASLTSIDDFVEEKKRLINVIDFLGRPIKESKNQPLFYIYDDGAVEKRIVIE